MDKAIYLAIYLSGRWSILACLFRLHETNGGYGIGGKMVTVNLSIDVPDLESGLAFYTTVFGFSETSRPFKEMAVVNAGNLTICIHEKPDGSTPSPQTVEVRRYSRHWTPVHPDFHVDNFDEVLEIAKANGAGVEQLFKIPGRKSVAFCSDPFGNGFCLIESAPGQT